jgi:cysteine desulfurase/selenocysteine lyase
VPEEVVFVRGATEGINLVAQSWGGTFLKPGDRIMLSMLEHHSNIVPWQIVAERVGAEIDVAPLTEDGRIDLEAMSAMLTERHKMVALAHVSNVLGSVLDVSRAAEIAHRVGAKLLVDGCQAVPRMPVDVQELGCDFYVFSAHKLYGPTGIGVLWGKGNLLDAMPPVQGGGAMIDKVTFAKTSFAPPPARFEAGTPHVVGVLGLHAAIDYVEGIGLEAIAAHEEALVRNARQALSSINSVRLFGPEDSAGIVSFAIRDVHPHDIGTILDESRVAIRAGHHCAQPLMEHLGVDATARASFGVYNGRQDVEALVQGIERVTRIFG